MKKIAIIGCGRILHKHLNAIELNKECRLVGVCDIKKKRLEDAVEKTGVSGYDNYSDMIDSELPDVVSILTESGSHSQIAHDVIQMKVENIIIEKPICLALEDADSLIEESSKAGTRLFIVKQNRYNPAIIKLREAFEMGRFGKIVLGTVRIRWMRTQKYYDLDSWRGTWSDDGGVFANQASHHIDLLQWFLGPVQSVQAYTATRLVNIETEDTGAAILKFTSGAIGIVEATTATRPNDLEGSISILGEKGTVVIGGFAVNRIETWNFIDKIDNEEVPVVHRQETSNVYGHGHVEFYQRVVESINERRSFMLDGFEGRKVLEIISAIYEASETGKQINLRYRQKQGRLGRRSSE